MLRYVSCLMLILRFYYNDFITNKFTAFISVNQPVYVKFLTRKNTGLKKNFISPI